MSKDMKDDNLIEELFDNKKANYLSKKEREIILFNIRKIVTDLGSLEMYLDQYTNNFTASDNNRMHQYIKNNQHRAKNILWQLTSLPFKKNKEIKNGWRR